MAKYGERPKCPGNVRDMATSKGGETPRGGRRAFLASFPCAALAANLILSAARTVRRCGNCLSRFVRVDVLHRAPGGWIGSAGKTRRRAPAASHAAC